MTVGQLIAALQEFAPDAPVYMTTHPYGERVRTLGSVGRYDPDKDADDEDEDDESEP